MSSLFETHSMELEDYVLRSDREISLAKIRLRSLKSTDDIISRLPDEIIGEILSRITTKQAVASSILSKRWSKIWTMVPSLDFSDFYTGESHYYTDESPLVKTRFMEFVDNVLRKNVVTSMHKVSLCTIEEVKNTRVKAWVNNIVTRDVEVFELVLHGLCIGENFDQTHTITMLPDTFFTCRSLVELSLHNAALKIPESVSFPCLKNVIFGSVLLLDDASMKNLLLGCPVIEKLDLDRIDDSDTVDVLYICSSTLRYLTLCSPECGFYFGSQISIDAPNLRHLDLMDWAGYDYDIVYLSNLVQVKVDLNIEIFNQTLVEVLNDKLFKLLRKISHVEIMHVSLGTISSLKYTLLEDVPMFNNLTHMAVTLGRNVLPILLHLCRSTPNLVTCVLKKDSHCLFLDLGSYGPLIVPQCFISSLKHVVFQNFDVCDDDIEFIKYILESAMVMKKMSVVLKKWFKDSRILELEKLLLRLPRSSNGCVFEVTNPRL